MSSAWSSQASGVRLPITASLLLLLGCTVPDADSGQACGAPGSICRVAGEGTLGFNGDGLPPLETWFYFPTALGRDPLGCLAIMDFNNMRLRIVDLDDRVATVAGNGVHSWSVEGAQILDSPLENPIDFRFDPAGGIYLLPLHEQRVLHVGEDGRISVVAGTGEEGFSGDEGPAREATLSPAAGIELGPDGSLYIADTENHRVRVVDPQGLIHTLAGTGEAGFSGDGGPATLARLNGPQRLHLDGSRLLIADSRNHAIRALDLDSGVLTTLAGTGAPGFAGDEGPATQATLQFPSAAIGDGTGRLWIADGANNRVREVGTDGLIRTLAGTGQAGRAGDGGPADQAELSWPADLLFGPQGELYVADMLNGTVRVIW